MRYIKKFVTKSSELGYHNAMLPTQIAQYLQEMAEYQLHDLDRDYAVLYREERKAYLLSRMSIEIYQPLPKYATIEGQTWVSSGRGAVFPRHHEFFCGTDVFLRATSSWALVNVDTKKILKFDDYDTSNYPFDEEPKMQIPNRFRIPRDLELHPAHSIWVGVSETDINGHMNNAMYLNHLYDEIPDIEKQFVTSINIRYVHEAPKGCDIDVMMSDFQEPGDLDPRADHIVYFKTTVGDATNIEAVFGLKWVNE